ncbi:MAG: hypothetical protein MHMPM18_002427 [Marteilia pararefringens]
MGRNSFKDLISGSFKSSKSSSRSAGNELSAEISTDAPEETTDNSQENSSVMRPQSVKNRTSNRANRQSSVAKTNDRTPVEEQIEKYKERKNVMESLMRTCDYYFGIKASDKKNTAGMEVKTLEFMKNVKVEAEKSDILFPEESKLLGDIISMLDGCKVTQRKNILILSTANSQDIQELCPAKTDLKNPHNLVNKRIKVLQTLVHQVEAKKEIIAKFDSHDLINDDDNKTNIFLYKKIRDERDELKDRYKAVLGKVINYVHSFNKSGNIRYNLQRIIMCNFTCISILLSRYEKQKF